MSIQNSHQIGNVKIMLVKGENGSSIVSITKTGTVGDVDTYTVATSDGGQYTFEVTNGSDIQSIEKTSSHGMVDTYTVTLTNGNTTTFEVTNGDNWIDNSEKTTTDAFQTITGGLLKECKVALSPVQSGSGDPSPTNVRPITGHTEVKVTRINRNALPFVNEAKSQSGLEVTPKSGGRYDFTGTSLANVAIQIPISVSLSGTYKFIVDGYTQASGSNVSLYVQNKGGGNLTAIVPNTDINFDVREVVSIAFYASTGAVCNYHDLGFALIADDEPNKSFEPYEGTTYTVEIPAETGTVYGGTLDVISGVLNNAFGIIDETDFSSIPAGVSVGGLHWAECNVTNLDFNGNGYSSMLVRKDGNAGWYSSSPCFALSEGKIRVYCTETDIATFKSNYADLQIVYALATPIVVQLTPTQVETLIGDNNLLCPLAGQAMVEDGVKYFYIYTYRDLMQGMQDIADALENDIDAMVGDYTTSASASIGDTSITISDANITTSSIIEVYCQNASGNAVAIKNMTVTTGQAVLTFYALAEATDFRLHILNI